MKIGITGGTGFIGRAVQQAASSRGDEVLLFSRRAGEGRRLYSTSSPPDVSGCEGLLHLAGEPILGLWTREKRRKILASRVEGTRRLVEGIAAATVRPRVLVSASAIGFYGDTGNRITEEESPAGRGFLAEVAQAWEEEARKAEQYGVRVVRLRIGFVLARDGGAMKLIAPLFRIGLGGRLGSGRQWMSCIAIDDLAAVALEALHNEALSGAVNAVMPTPVTNREFATMVARALHRPALFPVPGFVLKLILGNLSHLLLDSQRIIPARLEAVGFHYRSVAPAAAIARLFAPKSTEES